MRTVRDRDLIAFLPLSPREASRQWDFGAIAKQFGVHPEQVRQIDFIPADGGCVVRILHNGRRVVPVRVAGIAGGARSLVKIGLARLPALARAVGGRVTAIHDNGAVR